MKPLKKQTHIHQAQPQNIYSSLKHSLSYPNHLNPWDLYTHHNNQEIQKINKYWMQSLSLEVRSDKMLNQTSKKYYKSVINLEMKIWLSLKSEFKISKLPNHLHGDFNLNKFWLSRDKRRLKTRGKKKSRKRNNWRRK